MAEFSGRTRRCATTLSERHARWDDLEASGFSRVEQLEMELGKPHLVGFLFDTKDECREVVTGLHGSNYVLHEVLHDTDILYQWTLDHAREFDVSRREDRKAALRYKLQEKPRVSAPDAYNELLGMDVQLKARVSKASYRMQVKFPTGSKSDLEGAARERWLSVMVAYMEEAELPLVKVAKETSNPAEVMRRAFGARRMKTLRSRARSWAKVREWMIMFAGQPYPPDVSYMLEYLLFLVQEEVPKSRFQDTAAALAVLEDAGQVAGDMKISSMVPWVQGVRSRIAELEVNRTQVRKAPPPTVAMLLSLEVNMFNMEIPEYMRAMSWIILLCTWACLRLSDLEGLCPKRMMLGSRGLRGVLIRTKTTGPGKLVKETQIFVSRRISLSGHDWLQAGYELWDSYGHKDRDYFVMSTDQNMNKPVRKYASVERVAIYVRQVLMELKAVVKPRFQQWRHKDETPMFDQTGILYWSGHSMRHFLPTVAAAVDIGKEQRDYVGRWHVNLHQSADYVHTSRQIVLKVQEAVNKAIVEGAPGYDESELLEDYGCFLVTRGRMPADWIKHHAIWKKIDGSLHLGGTWPMIEVDFIDGALLEEPSQVQPPETINEGAAEAEREETADTAPFFVTISRHTGFRRLHKIGGCNIQPWACHKVEYLARVVPGVADAACKTCQRKHGKAFEEGPEESSTSGSSSSTELEDSDEGGLVQRDLGNADTSEIAFGP